jgi:glycosyltransferase involved in cell wall biosynthesis
LTTLALVMIVRNEARAIARCLRSVRPLVERMIVVDTGSVDDTVRIAEAAGAEVFHIAWTDDFAAARNAALDLSPADWNLVLDADEWIDDAAGMDALEVASACAAPFIGLLPVTSQFDLHGAVETETLWIPRLLPRGVRYTGRIHEQPASELERRRVALPIAHDGYRRAELDNKKGRNEALLRRALDEAPFDPYLLYQLARNYEVYEDYCAAVPYFRQALQLLRGDAAYRHDLVVRALFSLKGAGLHEEALALAEAEMGNWQHSPDFFFVLGDVLLDWAVLNPAIAFEQLLPIAEASWLKCLELGDQPALAGAVLGRGSHLAAHNLAVLYDGTGDPAKAAHYRGLAVRPR